MPGFIRVINRFVSLLESGDPAFLAKVLQRSSGQDFMGVALMADVEDQLIFFEVETMMQRHHGFDGAKVRGKMSAIDACGVDDGCAKLLRKIVHTLIRKLPYDMVAWKVFQLNCFDDIFLFHGYKTTNFILNNYFASNGVSNMDFTFSSAKESSSESDLMSFWPSS